MKKTILLALFFLVFISTFLRLYRISQLTEFLGDQGRTGMVIYEAWMTKTIPLAGPTVLSGQHLGPFFYYLMAPSFILSGFNPLGPSMFTAILGVVTVVLLFYISNKLFGFWIGFFIALLYAVSPSIITQDRIIWEPNVIPFFILLFIISVYKIYEQQKFKYFLLLGTTVGILIQLHYPNVFFIFLALLFLLFMLVFRTMLYSSPGRSRFATPSRWPDGLLEGGYWRRILTWSLAGMFGFFLILLPFLLYEAQHNFTDVSEIALIFLGVNSGNASSPPFYANMLDMSTRLFKHFIPLLQSRQLTVLQLTILIIPFVRRNAWHLFLLLWFVTGVFAISSYKGVVFDHYLMFLLPIPFLLFGFFVQTIETYVPKKIVSIPLLVLTFLQLTRTDIVSQGNNDLRRTQLMSNEIIQQSNTIPFSFTLISSRSFSDLHYRYYFKLHKTEPKMITGKDYELLFLVCEKSPCPTSSEIEAIREIQVLCYDPHCEGEYPKINLKEEFSLIKTQEVFDGGVFTYRRKEVDNRANH